MGTLKNFSLILITFFQSSCASLTPREKTLVSMGVGAIVGGVIGAVSAPEDESSTAHIAMWSGIGSAVGGVGGLIAFNEDKQNKEREMQIEALHNEVAALRGETPQSSSKKELFSSKNTLEKEVPKEYRNLVKPGEWSIYEIDQWVDSGDNMKIHQDKIFKLEPPQINVGSK